MSVPVVSVAIANHNGARYLRAAVRSALGQDLAEIEVIVVDDASTDDSVALAESLARADSRVRVERLRRRRGPGGARNRALELARGQWLAVLDGDDLMHPARLSRLVSRAQTDGADIVADDQLVFESTAQGSRFLRGARARAPTWLTMQAFLEETRMFAPPPNLGYLKPVIRLASWRGAAVRYDETLAIGEDHDVMLRLLMTGLRCRIDPFLGYFYRRHVGSASHRLNEAALAGIARAEAGHRARMRAPPPALARIMAKRGSAIESALAFTRAIEALKAGRGQDAARALATRPRSLAMFRFPLMNFARRLRSPPVRMTDPDVLEAMRILTALEAAETPETPSTGRPLAQAGGSGH